ncbi:unnamed protein product [Brachionus calyciflorus]|uniref:Uncharacterized protein n=1 Tax=Brachionus calyciflorus TaxID=104777 RepID=A0A814RDG1_9BILA|nr:unnamed protein product [Brachionus calyciflorus]
MINQAYHSLDYCPELEFASQYQMRPASNWSNRVRPSPYDAPSRNQANMNQLSHIYLNSNLIPTFTISQPMHPINMINNRATPTINSNNHVTNPNISESNNIQKDTFNEGLSEAMPVALAEPFYPVNNNYINKLTFTLKFLNNTNFDEKYRDYYFLEEYIRSL